jgi:hypothetical protein
MRNNLKITRKLIKISLATLVVTHIREWRSDQEKGVSSAKSKMFLVIRVAAPTHLDPHITGSQSMLLLPGIPHSITTIPSRASTTNYTGRS